jgi:hypothetical protein
LGIRKIVLIILSVIVCATQCLKPAFVSPEEVRPKGLSYNLEEHKKKISTIEEAISFLEKEISRDRDIASWGQNLVALKMTRDLLNRDLSEKKRILDNLKKELGDEIKDEIGFIGQNAEKEKEIGADVRIDIGAIKYTQAYIQENIQRKNDLLKTFKERLKK